MPEADDKGVGSLFLDYLRGDVPSQGDIRYSAGLYDHYGDDDADRPYSQDLYGDNPDFIDRLRARGYAFSEDGRPRRDLPTVQELIDARAHVLGPALYVSQGYAPGAVSFLGTAKEVLNTVGGSSFGDFSMDARNNRVGVELGKQLGRDVTPQEVAKAADDLILNQLDQVISRTADQQQAPAGAPEEAPYNYYSPEKGPDIYFPRYPDGTFNVRMGGG